jgi:hypothetical protein
LTQAVGCRRNEADRITHACQPCGRVHARHASRG